MTLFQSADRQPLNPNHFHNPSVIDQLHDDPEPFEQDTFASYSANPEEILMAKEALLNDYAWSGAIGDHLSKELKEDADCLFEEVAPTTTNLVDSFRGDWYYQQATITRGA